MSRWWRAYDEALHDPKLQRLPAPLFRTWFNLLCIASKNGGALPGIADVAFELRTTEHKAAEAITALSMAGLIDKREDGVFEPHNWDGRQFQSDTSNDRVKRHRQRKRNGECNVTSTVSVTPPETEQKQNREDAPSGAASKYAFESGVIRLTKTDFDKWVEIYPNLNLKAELTARTEWANSLGTKWFLPLSAALAKADREVGIRKSQPNGRVAQNPATRGFE